MTRRIGRMAIAAALALGGLACDEKLSDVAGPTPGLEPTFSSIQREIFDTTDASGRRACTGCHIGARPAGRLSLAAGESYGNLVGRPSAFKDGAVRVIPGDPDNSYLVQKLEGTPGILGGRMPFTGGPYLTAGQMQIIRRWIQLGAAND